ncbi:DUF309 domain-containing protein [Marinicrinis lubricantis]|uniref:DUF309 domain-containing protein n=1 Tax=Marinicrinis lubricantis TaxID=2086470 RepID=A0ABW1ITS6_9BACL
MNLPEELVQYLVYFHTERDFFECHEVMEEYWKKQGRGPYEPVWRGLIQLAVALYHERRGNVRGAVIMLASAKAKLDRQETEQVGIDRHRLVQVIASRLEQLEKQPETPYTDMDIPIDDPLMEQCLKLAAEQNVVWGTPSSMDNLEVVEKHRRRDRSEVIEARRASLEKRMAKRKTVHPRV